MNAISHKRVHKGEINSLAVVRDDAVASVGTDGCLYLSTIEDEVISSRLLYRATLSLKLVAASTDQLLACAGDERSVKVYDLQGSFLWASSTARNAICGLFFDTFNLMIIEEDGKLTKFDRQNSTSFVESGVTHLNADHSFPTKIATIDDRLYIGSFFSGLFVLARDSLEFIDHIRPPLAEKYSFCVLSSPKSIFLSHSKGLCHIDFPSNNISDDERISVEGAILDLVSDNLQCMAVTNEGKLISLHLEQLETKNQELERPLPIEKRKSPVAIFDDDSDDDDDSTNINSILEKKVITKLSKKKKVNAKNWHIGEAKDDGNDEKGMQEELEPSTESDREVFEELNSYDVPTDNAMDIDDNHVSLAPYDSNINLCAQSSIHRPFQPGATPFTGSYRFLAYNSVGVITSRADDGYWSVEIEFADKEFHHPIRFIDEYGYEIAAVGKAGAIFAKGIDYKTTEYEKNITEKIYLCPLTTWVKNPSFELDLGNERVLGVAIGRDKYAFIATAPGYLRTISINGLQGPIVNFSGKFVSIVAGDQQLMLITSDELTNRVFFTLYEQNTLKLLHHGDLGGRFQNKSLVWVGFSDFELPAVFDEDQVLHICNVELNYQWQPWQWSREQNPGMKNVWPISFSRSSLIAALLDNDYPEPVPRPIVSILSLRIPLLSIDSDPVVSLYEESLRTRHILSHARPGEIFEKECKRLQVASDKHLLELVQLAIKSERLTRVLELCKLFLLEKSWDLAVQLAKHNRLALLANRIEKLKEEVLIHQEGNKTETFPDKEYLRVVNTPKLPRKVAIESPSTTLANLMPDVEPPNHIDKDSTPLKLQKCPSNNENQIISHQNVSVKKEFDSPLGHSPFTKFISSGQSTDETLIGKSIVDVIKSVQQNVQGSSKSTKNFKIPTDSGKVKERKKAAWSVQPMS